MSTALNDPSSEIQKLPFGKDVEVFYDGECPLCRREIDMLRRLDRLKRIRFTDLCAPDFHPESLGVTHEQLMAEIYGRLPDGTLIKGVEVFRRLYGAVGFRWAVALTRLPGVRQILDVGYSLFARNRLRLTGRCQSGSCEIHNPPESQSD
ncbi:thiol-disulfide oxidoreductase DCC family protein [Planctomicrobium sp. SH661]|uniref:thiol-disulfide oxidoreductase DCC family protein n=1 Tax=Planctomicrobium sp. SH661 TaxID=3448124 RepID=UPI003F5C95FC